MNKQRGYDDSILVVTSSIPNINQEIIRSKETVIKNPSYYNKGIECWDYIVSHNMGFLEGNVIKYITRYKDKNGKADLLKAKQYLDKLIEEYEKTQA